MEEKFKERNSVVGQDENMQGLSGKNTDKMVPGIFHGGRAMSLESCPRYV